MAANRSNYGPAGALSSDETSLVVASGGGTNPALAAGTAGADRGQVGADRDETDTAQAVDIPLPDTVNSVPAAFEEADPEILADPESRERLTEIQEEFVEEIGGTERDTRRPDDGPIWRSAQWLADQRYRAQFGHTAFLAQQERAAAALARELEKQ
jgi:hypothetical protein